MAASGAGRAAEGAGRNETLTIGVITPLTGPGAAFGTSIQGAAQLAVDDVNKAGDVEAGDKTYTIKIKANDDRYQAADGLETLDQLAQLGKLNIYIDSFGGLVNEALAPAATNKKILNLTDGVGNYIGPDHPYMFPAGLQQGGATVKTTFSRVLSAVPGAFIGLSACMPGLDPTKAPMNDSPRAQFDDGVLGDAAAAYAAQRLAVQP